MTRRNNEVFLSNSIRSMNIVFQSIESTIATAFNRNRELILFSEGYSEVEAYDITIINDFLNSIVISNEAVSYTYYWRVGDNLIYRNDTVQKFHDLMFDDIIEESKSLSDVEIRFAWFSSTYIPEHETTDKTDNSVVMILGYPLLSVEKKAFVIVIMPHEKIKQWLSIPSEETGNFLEIQNLFSKKDIFNVNNDDKKVNWQNTYIDTSRGLYYKSGMKSNEVLFNLITWIYLPISIILSAIGLIWFVNIILNRNQTLDAIMMSITGSSKFPNILKNQDDLNFLRIAVEDLVQKATAVEDIEKRNQEYRISYLLLNLIDPIDSEVYLEKEFSTYVLPENQGNIIPIIIEIDNYYHISETRSKPELALIKLALKNGIEDLAQNQFTDHWVSWIAQDRLTILLSIPSEQKDKEHFWAESFAESLRVWCQDHLTFSITSVVASTANNWTDLVSSFNTAIGVLGLKPILGVNRILTEFDHSNYESDIAFSLFSKVEKMSLALRSGRDSWYDVFLMIFTEIRDDNIPKKDINRIMSYFSFVMEQEMRLSPNSICTRWVAHWRPQFKKIVKRFDLLDTLKDEIEILFRDMANAINESMADDKPLRILTTIQNHIRENYHNSDLSLDYYSEIHRINRSQLSRLFKERLGYNFVDYLITVRMDAAKELLATTTDKIEHIAKAVGYSHPFSFSRAFRQYTDMSPSYYRKQMLQQKEVINRESTKS